MVLLKTQINCPGVGNLVQEQTLDNLCGDLNKGFLPLNPIGQTVEGVSYPFDIFKSKALEYFSKTLPILKADDTLPKVAKYEDNHIAYNPAIFNSQPSTRISFYHHRTKRNVPTLSSEPIHSGGGAEAVAIDASQPNDTPRQSRGWCDDSYGVFCMLFNAFKGKANDKATNRIGDEDIPSLSQINSLESPMTPCPSAVEYVTPVFAKNYQGVWRYVVQIPYEGYFTQTVEVVKCLSTKCEYLDGSCLASPRWVSLLVAEVYYPDTSFPNPTNPHSNRSPVQGGNPPQDFASNQFSKKQGFQSQTATPPDKCDGHDEMGCYQVRLYYDWFLIPGSCKCWKNDFFEQYAAKNAAGTPGGATNRNTPYPTVTSNILDPTDDDTAMSPFPFRATKTLVMRSGTDVPAAKRVNPMI
eukprot:maker-scaffold1021_size70145-snap-gene-0.13 protein:Tk02176 transcript:maker-scaffold1021_size70145-snap-gene-0.13-mRNA-1 annotation:"PREDICTED: uncharacterized protein LOC100160712"